MKKQQVVYIHGGECFDSYEKYLEALKAWDYELPIDDGGGGQKKKWKYSLVDIFPNMEFIFPQMPNSFNAKYIEWKIWFEKVLVKTDEELIFIGLSLGGTFLLKYFSENTTDKKIKALFLIASAVAPKHEDYQLDTFELDFEKIKNMKITNIYIAHSQDDPFVPFSDFEILEKLLPQAEKMIFTDRGHFMGEEFPELVEKIREIG